MTRSLLDRAKEHKARKEQPDRASDSDGAQGQTQRAVNRSGGGDVFGWDDTATIGERSASDRTSERNTDSMGGRHDRDELLTIANEIRLIDLVREDNAEIGTDSGDCVAFDVCPVCGHHDCFRVYPTTNTWACFSDSMSDRRKPGCDSVGGNVLDYLEMARHMDKSDAARYVRERTGHPWEPDRQESQAAGERAGNGGASLPPWEPVQAVNPPKRSQQLIRGLLRRTHIGLYAGKGKVGKSFLAIELCIAVATGTDWLGFRCERGRCLYVDPEIDPNSIDNRFAEVADALSLDKAAVKANVLKWPLRGTGATIRMVARELKTRGESFDLILIDSCSCLMEGDENSSGDWSRFFIHVHDIANATGAAVMLCHHFGKGNAGDRDASDRFRGSSAIYDRPDVALTLTELFPKEGKPEDYLADNAHAFEVEVAGQREFPAFKPRHVVFEHPRHYADAQGVTDGWRPQTSTGQSRGGKQTAELNKARAESDRKKLEGDLLAWFYADGVGTEGRGITECAEHFGVSANRVQAAVEGSEHLDIYKPSKNRKKVVPRHIPRVAGDDGESEDHAAAEPLPLDAEQA